MIEEMTFRKYLVPIMISQWFIALGLVIFNAFIIRENNMVEFCYPIFGINLLADSISLRTDGPLKRHRSQLIISVVGFFVGCGLHIAADVFILGYLRYSWLLLMFIPALLTTIYILTTEFTEKGKPRHVTERVGDHRWLGKEEELF